MKRLLNILTIVLILLISFACTNEIDDMSEAIFINEICSSNITFPHSETNKYYDWIEFYNPSDDDVNLHNYRISDNEKNLDKFLLPNVIIKSKGYLILYFDKEDGDRNKLIAPFGLSQTGETLYLSKPNKKVIDTITFPALDGGTSFGRYVDGDKEKLDVLTPTPNEKNQLYNDLKVAAPVFSAESGFYDDEFLLYLEASDDKEIYYTLDCSDPSKESIKYNGEGIRIYDVSASPNVLKSRDDIATSVNSSYDNPVDKGFVVRAISLDSNGDVSDIVTNTYFIGQSKYKDSQVVSLVTDSYNLVDSEYGIYIRGKEYEEYLANGKKGDAPEYNWSKTGKEWERTCNLMILNNGAAELNQNCGMRIHGFGGRGNALKSFNIYARAEYGNQYFENPIFNGAKKTSSITLKYDRFSNSKEKYRDGFLQSLMSDSNVCVQDYEMCILFLNGEYWQSYMIMEKYSDDSIADKYNVDKNDIVLIKENQLEEGTEEDYNDYNAFKSFVKTTNFSKASAYDELAKKVDIENVIDFYATQIYYNHFDYSYLKNVLIWKTRTKTDDEYGDGRWRWMLYDFDYGAVNVNVSHPTSGKKMRYDYATNTFTADFLFATDFKDDYFFHRFMKNDRFRSGFVTRFCDLANTTFNKDNIANKLLTEYNASKTTLNTFFDNRFEYIMKYLAEYLEISDVMTEVNIITNKNIIFNSLSINSSYKGRYFNDSTITINSLGADIDLKDLEIVSKDNNIYILKIKGSNPTITIK